MLEDKSAPAMEMVTTVIAIATIMITDIVIATVIATVIHTSTATAMTKT